MDWITVVWATMAGLYLAAWLRSGRRQAAWTSGVVAYAIGSVAACGTIERIAGFWG